MIERTMSARARNRKWPRPALARGFERKLAVCLMLSFGFVWLVAGQGVGYTGFAATIEPPQVSPTWLPVVLLVALIALNGIFISAETGVDLLRPVHYKHFKDHEPESARRVQKLLDGKQQYVAACSIGSQVCRLALVFVGFLLAQGLALQCEAWLVAPYDFGTIVVCAVVLAIPVSLLNLVLGELVPKSFASLHPHRVGVRLYRFIRVIGFVLSPLSSLVVAVANLITARFGGQASFAIANQAEEEIKNLVETAQETGEIEVDEKELLHSVFEFNDTVAREVMTPRVDMDAMPADSDPVELIKVIEESGHSRIPLYEQTDDQIVGIIHAKDLLTAMLSSKTDVTPKALMRAPMFVPENKNLHELLAEMRTTRSQMAVVQDEFGGTAGIVTIEDIVEELVGDIVDEYDVDEPEFVKTDSGYLVDGKAHLDDVNSEIGSQFESEEFDTVGGFVFGLFGRQPKPGESIDADGFRFGVSETDGRRIFRLQIEPLQREASLDEEPESERTL